MRTTNLPIVILFALLTACVTGKANAQHSLDRVSGNLLSVSIVDAGGWSGQTECNCSGSDIECDKDEGWPSAASSETDLDFGSTIECCGAKPEHCASSPLTLNSISASIKSLVWSPKLFGQPLPWPADTAFAYAMGFNDLVLKVVDTSNPDRKFNIDARIIIESQFGDPLYVEVGGDGASFSLSVTAALTANETVELDESFGCADGEIVSEWDDVTLYTDGWESGCSAIQEDTGWANLGTVCQGDEFRLGFLMLAAGIKEFQTHGVEECTNANLCIDTQMLRIVLQVRAVSAGVNCP